MIKNNRFKPDILVKNDVSAVRNAGWSGKRIGFGVKTAILVVDMTRNFIEPRFPLACSKTGVSVAKAIKKLLDKARPLKIPIIYTKGSIWKTRLDGGRWLDKGLKIEKISEEDSEILDAIKPQKEEIVITKEKPSAFFGTQLMSILNLLHIDTIIVTGLTTSGCIRATVVDAFSYNFRVIIPSECVGDRIETSHKVSLFDMDTKYADVIPLSKTLSHLK
jgi:nicotinamidase-related amidase